MMKTRLILVGLAEDVEECVSIGDALWIHDDEGLMLGGPLTVMVCEDADGPPYTNLAQLRDLADGGLISTEHPEFVALRDAGFVIRGVPTEKAPWLDKWYMITDVGRAALTRLEGDDGSTN